MSNTIAPIRRRDKQSNEKTFGIDEVATELILEHGAMILKDARRYSSCLADAEDAYQRSLVIMLTQAPSTKPEELVPWLRVVVRREASAIARERRRVMSEPLDEIRDPRTADEALPEEHALDALDVELGIEALAKLKPDQIKCLLAQADGKSYAEISDATGFSARKVARSVNEGRRAFMVRVAAIESGSECERVDSLLAQISDGDEAAIASAQMHLKNCPGCRAAVRDYTGAPQRAVVLFPPTLLAVSSTAAQSPMDQLSAVWHGAVGRVNMHVHAAQQWAEIGTYKKAAAVIALTATVATGGAVAKHVEDRHSSEITSRAPEVVAETKQPRKLFDEVRVARTAKARTHHKRPRSAAPKQTNVVPPSAAPPQQISSPNQSIGDGSSEFLPEQR